MAPFRNAEALSILRCPRDGGALERREIASIVVHHCATCRGVWLDLETLDQLQGDRGLRNDVADDPCAHAPRPERLPDATRAARCCECGRTCTRRAYAPGTFLDVDIDICILHGMWMDPGHLFAVLYHEGLSRS
jgi:Zn-finger nucleic acid-binding protein